MYLLLSALCLLPSLLSVCLFLCLSICPFVQLPVCLSSSLPLWHLPNSNSARRSLQQHERVGQVAAVYISLRRGGCARFERYCTTEVSIVHLLSLVKAVRVNRGSRAVCELNETRLNAAGSGETAWPIFPRHHRLLLLPPWASPAVEKYMRVSRWTLRLSAGGTLSAQAQQHKHISTRPLPQRSCPYHPARKQPAPPAWILPLIPLHRPDWILAAKAHRSVRAGCR